MYKCVIFDFDGTIGDTEDLALQIAIKLSEKYNFRKLTKNEIPMIKHMTVREGMTYMGISRFRLPFIVKEAHGILRQEVSSAELCRPELEDLFHSLSDSLIMTGIITSNSADNVEAFFELHNIQMFDFLRSSSVFGKSKHLKKVLHQYNFKKRDVLYVGDEARDIVAAKKVGIDVAAVTWGFNSIDRLKAEKPNYLIEEVSELKRILGF
ncbi:HAD-IA family hydrolase [Clostridia bacterium]|nr:HAD-IA family hydrolase [Clostridia bacterium]